MKKKIKKSNGFVNANLLIILIGDAVMDVEYQNLKLPSKLKLRILTMVFLLILFIGSRK